MTYFWERPHCTIAFQEPARLHLLGAQMEQGLRASDAAAEGSDAAQARHGNAGGQLGVLAALVAIFRFGTDSGIQEPLVTLPDVELAQRIVDLSLLLKSRAAGPPASRPDEGGRFSSQGSPFRGASGDYDRGRFAEAFASQPTVAANARAPSQAAAMDGGLAGVVPSAGARADSDEDAAAGEAAASVDSARAGSDAAGSGALLAIPAPPPATMLDMREPDAVSLRDLGDEKAFFQEGFRDGGAQLLQAPAGANLSDKRLLQRVLLQGKDS
eukprot:9155622-Alexandrium_andersonii.AAC.1